MTAKYFICPTLKALISTNICGNNKKKNPIFYDIAYTCRDCENSKNFQSITYTIQEIIDGSHSEKILHLEPK